MNWFLKGFRDCIDFSGRARRTEYWMFTLFNGIFSYSLMIFCMTMSFITKEIFWIFLIYYPYTFAIILPGLAVTVRRLHDTDRSGFWCFFSLIPIVGPVFLIIYLCEDGTPSNNKYGPDPKGRGIAYRNLFSTVNNTYGSSDNIDFTKNNGRDNTGGNDFLL